MEPGRKTATSTILQTFDREETGGTGHMMWREIVTPEGVRTSIQWFLGTLILQMYIDSYIMCWIYLDLQNRYYI